MPNGLNGILLGQIELINILDISEMRPRSVLLSLGKDVAENHWGIISVRGVTIDDEYVELEDKEQE